MRSYRGTFVILLLSLVLSVYPAAAEVRPIDPTQPAAPVLEPAERDKLATLLGWTMPVLISDVSPDDRSILIAHRKLEPEPGAPPTLEFLNVGDGTRIPVEEQVRALPPMTEVLVITHISGRCKGMVRKRIERQQSEGRDGLPHRLQAPQ